MRYVSLFFFIHSLCRIHAAAFLFFSYDVFLFQVFISFFQSSNSSESPSMLFLFLLLVFFYLVHPSYSFLVSCSFVFFSFIRPFFHLFYFLSTQIYLAGLPPPTLRFLLSSLSSSFFLRFMFFFFGGDSFFFPRQFSLLLCFPSFCQISLLPVHLPLLLFLLLFYFRFFIDQFLPFSSF